MPPRRPRKNSSFRPQRNGGSIKPPPGLKGKALGLFYKNRQMDKKKYETELQLRIPQKVMYDIYKCLDKIESIAIRKNIYVPPVKQLNFVKPCVNKDYIPIAIGDSEQITHEIKNVRKREDDDIVFVKAIDPDVTEVIDISIDEVTDLTSDNETDAPQPSGHYNKEINDVKKEVGKIYKCENAPQTSGHYEKEIEVVEKEVQKFDNCKPQTSNENFCNQNIKVKREIKEESGELSVPPPCLFYMDTNPSTAEGNASIIKEPGTSYYSRQRILEPVDLECTAYSLSNNYQARSNNSNTITEDSNTYKYSYDDIITETFQEKLEKCLAQGIEITKTGPKIDDLNTTLRYNHMSMKNTNTKFKEMLVFRETLPTYQKGQELLEVIENNQVVVISGETGCGKSTQVPQLILDKALETSQGANVKILVTEPRRIAASSLAARVAEERGERMGDSVGYCVRLEAVSCRERGSIRYCTTGVLLVELEQNQALSEFSHVILDEVHERDCQIDIAMCMLKQVLQKRKDLKLILMSATIDAETLSTYFDDCPMFHIEGLAYPVHDVYMEGILQMTNFKPPPPIPNFVREPKLWHKYAYKNVDAVHKIENEMRYKADVESWVQSLYKDKKYSLEIIEYLSDHRVEELNLDLILELLKYICKEPPGAILVFLPGISEISKLLRMMNESYAFPERDYNIYSLHSKLPSIDQKQIFQRPPIGVRKIIVATNIAETSITIDDVVYVVDCGKMKYKGLDVEKNFATLQNEWVSKANLKQRRGRAGRCQPGICYHLITSHRAELLPDRISPELQRSNLLEEVLCMKKLRLGMAEKALQMMPAIPAEKTIKTAIKHLQQVGALDDKETLTPMGWHLARLPVPPAAGKLLVLGALFGCLDRAASLAAVWGFKDPFQLVIGKQVQADEKKRELAAGEPSDHVAATQAIILWEGSSNKPAFAREYFLSYNTLELLSSMKRQFAQNLKEMGFLTHADTRSPWENRNENNMSLFKAIVAGALYPNIANVRWTDTPRKPLSITAFTPEDGKVSMHPSSVLHVKDYQWKNRNHMPICTTYGADWLVYGLKQKSSALYLLDVTCVYTLPLVFFGELNFTRSDKPNECLISILSSYTVVCDIETAQLLYRLRSLLDQVLTFRIGLAGKDSKKRIEFDQEVLSAVIDLITAEDVGVKKLSNNYCDDDYYEYK